MVLGTVVLVLAAGCVQVPAGSTTAKASAEPGEIPFTLAGAGEAAIVVPVRLNGAGPYDFVLDTGATLTCLDAALADELDLPTPTGMVGRGATIGGGGQMQLRRLESIAIGEASATGVTVCALDLEHIRGAGLDVHGLLGLNVLKAYTVTIDFERSLLSLVPPA